MFRDFEVNRARAFYSRTDNELEVLYCCHGKLDSPEFFVIGREKSSSFFFFPSFFFNHCQYYYSNELKMIIFEVEGRRLKMVGWLYREFLNFCHFKITHFKIFKIISFGFRVVSSLLYDHFKIIRFEQFQNHIKEFQMLFQIWSLRIVSRSI